MINFEIINEAEYRKRGVLLWRYFDLHKFISFIKNKEIRFTRMDNFEDPLEGVPLRALVEYAEERDLEMIGDEKLSDLILDKEKIETLSAGLQGKIRNIRNIQRSTFVSCWFLSKRESMAMWNLYSNSEGVAVYIRASNLLNHFENEKIILADKRIQAFYSGKVHYQDFKTIDAYEDSVNLKVPKVALRKDESYKHEEEYRFVIRKKNGPGLIPSFSSIVNDLESLSMRVICHPQMELWKRNNVIQLLNEAGLTKAIKESEIRLRKIN